MVLAVGIDREVLSLYVVSVRNLLLVGIVRPLYLCDETGHTTHPFAVGAQGGAGDAAARSGKVAGADDVVGLFRYVVHIVLYVSRVNEHQAADEDVAVG